MASLLISALFLITIFSLQSNSVFAQRVEHSEPSSYNLFADDLLSAILDQESNKNVVYSPVSIYAILSLIYMGAGGSTENELRSVLRLDQNQGKCGFASNYRNFLETTLNKTVSKDEDAPTQLSMANNIYVSKNIKISELFKKNADYYFKSGVENVDFKDRLATVQEINRWVEEQTLNKIKDLMKSDAIDEQTSMVLVNAIYLADNWLTSFNSEFTSKLDFYLNRKKIVKVDTMFNRGGYYYIELPELNAKAVKLELQNSDISMLIILPNEVDGLEQVEENLKRKDLNEIVSNMGYKYLDLYLPKFRLEYEIDLKEPLNKMGCSSMFGNNANLTDIFDSNESHAVSKVVHKVVLDCNEKGLEAAGATYADIDFRMGVMFFDNPIALRVDHPFFFALRNEDAVFFAGHVVNLK